MTGIVNCNSLTLVNSKFHELFHWIHELTLVNNLLTANYIKASTIIVKLAL